MVYLQKRECVILLVRVCQPDIRLARTAALEPAVLYLPVRLHPLAGVGLGDGEAVTGAVAAVRPGRPVIAETEATQPGVPVGQAERELAGGVKRQPAPQRAGRGTVKLADVVCTGQAVQ